ncbi:site-specific DNA-methyltransferase [Candidatus Symbiobacter mobilis]|uniref:site-specific DNA-methyltransferase (adenine-specific) n=1 Tax=Candidatus Symbiobacter mobilis CR TaxID=946483 RepID=U5N7R5_9BURK|nr:site-specific DNA-methyltransferase [Candidatus Symbiobacter mobilis]AGX87417.1 DNA methylase [Candidatus Symbiobacter mobilis CR]
MPTLNWIGKEAVVKHHKEVPFRMLEPAPELSCGGSADGNLIVQGDNLHALKSLLPRYAGQVQCIYIDPPYNTGNEGWVYNDNVNSPEIRKWLGEVVGKEGETLDRHDRWLCMMYPRLVLLRQFLREDGAIFVSIDDNEVATLRLLMDEVFGARNFVANFVWEHRKSSQNDVDVSLSHNYTLCFARDRRVFRLLALAIDATKFSNPDNDPRGEWVADPMDAPNIRENLQYPISNPKTGKIYYPPPGRHWRFTQEKFELALADSRILFGKKGTSKPQFKRFKFEAQEKGVNPSTIWTDVGTATEGTKDLMEIFSGSKAFDTPKPTRLLQRILQIATDKNSLILDSFAGSGTTAHAVLKQNAEDGGHRRFLLVEMDEGIARNVTAERVRRVARGYTNAKGQQVPGLGGGFQFCRLSAKPLFDAEGQIRSDVRFAQLAEFVWFAETGTGYTGPAHSPLLGVHQGRAIYLLYNGILADRSVDGGNVLTGAVFDLLSPFPGPKVIYAAANRMGSRTAREGITFKQTPYALDV